MKTILFHLLLFTSIAALASPVIELEVDGQRSDLSDALATQTEIQIPLTFAHSVILHITPEPQTHWDFVKMSRLTRGQTVIRDLQEGIQSKSFDIVLISPENIPATFGQALVLLTKRTQSETQDPIEKTVLIRVVLGQIKEEK